MKETPRVCTGVIIVNPRGEMLLLRSHKFNHQWIVPGGGVEWGETMKACVTREAKEETGLDITDVKFLDADEEIFPKEFHKKQHFIFLDFYAKTAGTEVVLNDEAEEHQWVAPDAALKMNLNPSTRRFIGKYLHAMSPR